MDKNKEEMLKEVADELSCTRDEVLEIIDSMETLVTDNIRKSDTETIYETRIMGFGSFIGKKDKALKRLFKNT